MVHHLVVSGRISCFKNFCSDLYFSGVILQFILVQGCLYINSQRVFHFVVM